MICSWHRFFYGSITKAIFELISTIFLNTILHTDLSYVFKGVREFLSYLSFYNYRYSLMNVRNIFWQLQSRTFLSLLLLPGINPMNEIKKT